MAFLLEGAADVVLEDMAADAAAEEVLAGGAELGEAGEAGAEGGFEKEVQEQSINEDSFHTVGEYEGDGYDYGGDHEYKGYDPVYYEDDIDYNAPIYGDSPHMIDASQSADTSNALRGLNQNASHVVEPPPPPPRPPGLPPRPPPLPPKLPNSNLRLMRTAAEWIGLNAAVQSYNQQRAWNNNH